jgi:hypothetical protein
MKLKAKAALGIKALIKHNGIFDQSQFLSLRPLFFMRYKWHSLASPMSE